MTSPLVGRDRELRAIDGLLAAAVNRTSRIAAVVGEPGIGKSRLALEVAERGRELGLRACWGRAWEAGGAPPYWPMRLLFDSLPGSERFDRDGALGKLWGRNAAASPTTSDPTHARFELFDAAGAALEVVAEHSPLLCIVDDLHSADLPSLELLHFLVQRTRAFPVAWLLTWRDAEAQAPVISPLISKLAREATVLPLQRLSQECSDLLVKQTVATMSDATRAAIFVSSGGNPLFIVETVRCLVLQGASATDNAELPVAQGITEVVRTRLEQLAPSCRDALSCAAAVGRDVSSELWSLAAEVPVGGIRDLAAACVASGLMTKARVNQRYSFSHELVREAVISASDPGRIRTAWLQIAEGLDQRVQAGDVSVVNDRADYALRAADELDASTVLSWVVEASTRALAQCGYEQATALLRRARDVLGPVCDKSTSYLLTLARAHMLLGDTQRAGEVLRVALTVAERDPVEYAEAVLASGARYVLGDLHLELVSRIDDALARLGGSHPLLRARLLGRKAAALTPARDPAETLAMAREAVELADGAESPLDRIEVAVSVGSAMADFAHPRERIPNNRSLAELGLLVGDRALALRGLSRLVTDHVESGDLPRADQVLAQRNELARALRLPRFSWMEPLFTSMRAMIDGRFDDCARALVAAEKLCEGFHDGARCLIVHRTWLWFLKDDVAAMEEHEARVLEVLRTMPEALSMVVRAVVAYRRGDLDAARDEIEALGLDLPHCAVNTLATFAEVVAHLGSEELVHAFIDRLTPHRRTNAIWGLFGLTCGPPVSAALGLLTSRLGRIEDARELFEEALAQATRSGARAHRPWIRYWHAKSELEAGAEGKGASQAALPLLEAARDDALSLGMAGLARRIESLKAPTPSRPDVDRATSEPEPPMCSIARDGDGWRVSQPGKDAFVVRNLRGMQMLARLVAAPDQEIHVLDLVAEGGQRTPDNGDAGDLLDDEAIASYRKHLKALDARIEDADERGLVDAADRARSERDAVRAELARAVGLGGRKRRASAASERARVSAQRRIRAAIQRIASFDPQLGAQLSATVRTGTYCEYRPRSRRKAKQPG